ncbi:baculoviral IAP repeat-containing protein 5.2-like [Petromyzon marinus]|uniref:Baculoviral IAP repeat-containing protein 5.2-like n=1 Tax=Petromyzon marinus TaxID=7757 RepID=A0AAJ7X6J5_PETMA|nr:baculoviral IAP repeat-containing protein 5.2-like [Petromyzon marinus]
MAMGVLSLREFATGAEFYEESRRAESFAASARDGGWDPAQMAAAGFVCLEQQQPGVDVTARCFFCLLEVRGWISGDDPRQVHALRSPACAFLALRTPYAILPVEEFLRLELQRAHNYVREMERRFLHEFMDSAATVRLHMERFIR